MKNNSYYPRISPIRYILTCFLLFLFGWTYNRYVHKAQYEGREEDIVAEMVIFGTLVTLIPVGFWLGWKATWQIVGFFASSGFWMWYGSHQRWLEKQRLSNILNRRVS